MGVLLPLHSAMPVRCRISSEISMSFFSSTLFSSSFHAPAARFNDSRGLAQWKRDGPISYRKVATVRYKILKILTT